MYEDLVKQLRYCADAITCRNCLWKTECCPTDMQKKAADAIEELSKRPEIPETGIGDLSDGYHTFNGLYYQRMMLFAALTKAYKGMAWKSYRHEDGELCFGGGWFIVGIDTPQGSYTYHYEDKYWNWFECEELLVSRHWDGHTEEDVTRLLSLPKVRPVVRGTWGYRWKIHGDGRRPTELFPCSECGFENTCVTNFCPNCGAKMDSADDV